MLIACWDDHAVVLTTTPSTAGEIVRVDNAFLQTKGERERGRACEPGLRPYLGMRNGLSSRPCQYFEARLDGVPAGAEVRYDFAATTDADPEPPRSVPADPNTLAWSLYASNPPWAFEDIIAMHTPASLEGQYSWVVYHQEADGLQHVRVDLSDVDELLHRLRLKVGDMEWHFEGWTAIRRRLPRLDRNNDYVIVSLPQDAPVSPIMVTAAAPQADESVPIVDVAKAHREPLNLGTVNVMLVQFCIQALNDLFESPIGPYVPPRTYMQVTMRDEMGVYSSRPRSPENSVEDGYALTLAAHCRNRVPYLWTFNAGLLALIAHDCPDDLAYLRTAIAEGLLDPTVVGFAGHRLPYYQPATNRYIIKLGVQMMRTYLGGANTVFYPDSRFYKAETDREPLRANGMRYLVVDADTTLRLNTYRTTATPEPDRTYSGRYFDHQYLWRDRASGLYLLMIQTDLRNGMFGHTDDEYERGKLPLQLRRKFLGFAATPARRDNLLVYGDDADKCSGNGWFDGNYDGTGKRYNDMWTASIEWIAAHPWVRVVTSRDLEGSPVPPLDGRDPVPCIGEFTLGSAIDPSVDPGGVETRDTSDKDLHFDAWYDSWKDYRATWLDQTLEQVSQEAEFAVLDWPRPYRDQTRLYELAQMSFAGLPHELPWNKQPLENGRPNDFPPLDPEDFVVASSLQVRNTHVYLAATVWAEWAATGGTGAFCDDGPVVDTLPTLRYANDNPMAHLRGMPLQDSGVHWDHDPIANVILYNAEALVVFDRNGGRITHLFSLVDGEPLCVSGTFKCYQYTSADGTICDGPVVQNTVFTPNHAYVATDLEQTRAILGTMQDPRRTSPQPWWYPDNFNVYEDGEIGGDGGRSVGFRYRPGSVPPPTIDMPAFTALLEQDRRARQGSGEPPVVWHDPANGSFDKTVTLHGRTLTVAYTGVRPGHVVANEFCVDLWAAMNSGAQLIRHVGAADGTVALGDATVTVVPGPGCTFSDDTRATLHDRPDRYLRGHRVLTDRLDVVCPTGGDFFYTITLP